MLKIFDMCWRTLGEGKGVLNIVFLTAALDTSHSRAISAMRYPRLRSMDLMVSGFILLGLFLVNANLRPVADLEKYAKMLY